MSEAQSGNTGSEPRHLDEPTGQPTTGHVWDGITELDRPLPRWWLWTFYATIAFSVVYMVLYPSIPLVDNATRGLFGYSTRGEVHERLDEARAAKSGNLGRIAAMDLEAIRADDGLARFARAGGESAFKVNCVQCHGTGAAGSRGYPNLNDDEWLWGGTLDDIRTSIMHGIRFDADDETRISGMPAFGADGLLAREGIRAVAEHVIRLAGREADRELAAEGAQVYADNCAACHGDDGSGSREFGAPALNDAIWLYGSTREDILAQIYRPSHGVMPAWGGRLDETTVKQLAIYVHALGGGEAAAND